MAVMVIFRWDGVTTDDYDRALEQVKWEENPSPGGLFHVASYDGTALRITDVWESAEDFQRFVEQELMPGTAQLGLPGEPQVEIYPVHRIFAPGYEPKR
jgi:hypothetical protein